MVITGAQGESINGAVVAFSFFLYTPFQGKQALYYAPGGVNDPSPYSQLSYPIPTSVGPYGNSIPMGSTICLVIGSNGTPQFENAAHCV